MMLNIPSNKKLGETFKSIPLNNKIQQLIKLNELKLKKRKYLLLTTMLKSYKHDFNTSKENIFLMKYQ